MITSDLPKIAPKFTLASAMILMLSACSAFEPDYVACPDISVSEEASRAYIEGTELGQLARVRFNGADARCVETASGFDMVMDLGFLLKRDISVSSLSEEVPIDITVAYVDENNDVAHRYIHSDTVFFPDYEDKARPIITLKLEVPTSTRIVMGIGKVVE